MSHDVFQIDGRRVHKTTSFMHNYSINGLIARTRIIPIDCLAFNNPYSIKKRQKKNFSSRGIVLYYCKQNFPACDDDDDS